MSPRVSTQQRGQLPPPSATTSIVMDVTALSAAAIIAVFAGAPSSSSVASTVLAVMGITVVIGVPMHLLLGCHDHHLAVRRLGSLWRLATAAAATWLLACAVVWLLEIPSVPIGTTTALGPAILTATLLWRGGREMVAVLIPRHTSTAGHTSHSHIGTGRIQALPPDSLPEVGEMIAGRSILITGAGGSIGSELCMQLMVHRPRRLVLLEHSEFNLYRIQNDLQSMIDESPSLSEIEIHARLGDVRHQQHVLQEITRHDVTVVFHAAAFKHVPIVEENEIDGVDNNVLGTWHVAEAAARGGVETFILISTDKADSPVSVMGAGKRLAEQVIGAMQQRLIDQCPEGQTPMATRSVRFGNVVDSSGSVIPRFRAQIDRGGPVTITHPDARRFFMSVSDAVELILHAAVIGEPGSISMLDMGPSIRIEDLARRMIRHAGCTVGGSGDGPPGNDRTIEIVYTGLRPGERLEERLPTTLTPRTDRLLHVPDAPPPWSQIETILARLGQAIDQRDADAVRSLLIEAVVEYPCVESMPTHQGDS